MSTYPGVYRARALQVQGGVITAYVPQVFGDTPISITDVVGGLPDGPTNGWVLFESGWPEFPVWSSGSIEEVLDPPAAAGVTFDSTGLGVLTGTDDVQEALVATDTWMGATDDWAEGTDAALAAKQNLSEKDQANGYPGLNANARLQSQRLSAGTAATKFLRGGSAGTNEALWDVIGQADVTGLVTSLVGKGPIPLRISRIARLALVSPASMQMVVESDTKGIWLYDGAWVEIVPGTAMPTGLTLEAPQTLPLNTGLNYAAYGSGWGAPSYWKDPDGWVHLGGLIRRTSGTPASGEIMGTLPVGYRPQVGADFLVYVTDQAGYIAIGTGGQVYWGGAISANPSGFLSLDGVSFPSFGASGQEMVDTLRPAGVKMITANALQVGAARWLSFCRPRADGLVRGWGGSINHTASGVQGYLPDMMSSRYHELHSIFAFNGTPDPGRMDVEGNTGRLTMYDTTFGAACQNDITGKQFWPGVDNGWANLPLSNGWINYVGAYPPGRYRKDAYGVVHLSGMVSSGTTTFGTTIGTLPVGYRPVRPHLFTQHSGSGACRIDVQTNGTVTTGTGTVNSFLTLEDIRFRTDA